MWTTQKIGSRNDKVPECSMNIAGSTCFFSSLISSKLRQIEKSNCTSFFKLAKLAKLANEIAKKAQIEAPEKSRIYIKTNFCNILLFVHLLNIDVKI